MKRVVISAALCALFFEMSNGMLVRYNPDSGAIARREETQTISRTNTINQDLVRQEETILLPQVNIRQILQPELNGDTVIVRVRDCKDDELVGEWFKEYPLIRQFLRYEHNFEEGKSYPVLKLFADVRDIKHANKPEAIIDPEFEDEAHALIHQRRETGSYENDDEHLQAKQLSEIFILTESGEQVIDEAKVREGTEPISYERVDEKPDIRTIGDSEAREGDDEFNYQRTETFEKWRRPDGTIFTKRTEGEQKVAKPKPPAPVQPKPATKVIPVMAHKKGGTWYHHWTNHWQAGTQVVDINDPRDHIDIWP